MSSTDRRSLLRFGAAAGSTILFPCMVSGNADAATLRRTERQVEGPYYPPGIARTPSDFSLDQNNDLIWINGRTGFALGTLLELSGRILDSNGRPLRNIEVHLWQCDTYGRYHHPGDTHTSKIDRNFQGFGLAVTDGDGRYNFRTIKPVAYPGRTPHIHFKLKNATSANLLTTQMYVGGDPANANDSIYQAIAVDHRPTVTATIAAPKIVTIGAVNRKLARATFNMVLGVTPTLL
jgi:protocatechuate 3,4-dioxygenase, beta subunit